MYLTRVRGKYRDLLQAPGRLSAVYLLISGLSSSKPPASEDVKWAWPSGRGRGGVKASAPSVVEQPSIRSCSPCGYVREMQLLKILITYH